MVADFCITGLEAWETWDSFDTSQAGHFGTTKGLIEISGTPALVSTTGLLPCTFK